MSPLDVKSRLKDVARRSSSDSCSSSLSSSSSSSASSYAEEVFTMVPLVRHVQSAPISYLPLLLVLILFPLSTCLLLAALTSLPVSLSSFPHTLDDLATLGRDLQAYFDSSSSAAVHILAVLAFTAAWKHAWSVPGSVLLNVLAGALLPLIPSILFMTALTTLGSVLSTLLAAPLSPLLTYFLPRSLQLTRHALDPSSTTPPWVRLTILRLISIVPWSGLNIACGVVGVPLLQCAVGAFIGCLPWTAVTCQIGDLVRSLAHQTPVVPTSQSIQSLLTSPTLVAKLALLSLASLAPIILRARLTTLIPETTEKSQTPTTTTSASWLVTWRKRSKVVDIEMEKR